MEWMVEDHTETKEGDLFLERLEYIYKFRQKSQLEQGLKAIKERRKKSRREKQLR
jgi:hypothetical protein